jgi:hypothetical protein
MKWPWSKPETPSYRALRAQFIEHSEGRRSMRETPAVQAYEAGTLRPTFLPNSTGAGPGLMAPAGATPDERRARVEALEAERVAWTQRCERLQGTLSRARTASARIREQLAAAETRERSAGLALAEAAGNHDAAVIGHERFLRETADPLIDEVLVFLRDQLDGLQRRGVLQMTERVSGPRNPITLLRPRQTFTNVESIQARRLAIMAAITIWEGNRLAAIDPLELRAWAEALPVSLPAIDESVATPIEPLLTVAEARELEWRAAEKEARR